MVSKYELALDLFGDSASVVVQNDCIRLLLNIEPHGEFVRNFGQDLYNQNITHVRHLSWFLSGAKEMTILASATSQLSTWEFILRFEDTELVGDNESASISTRRQFHLDFDVDAFLMEDHRQGKKKTPYIQSPDFDPNDEESRRREYRKIAEWIDSNQPERNTVNFNGIKTWNSLEPLMDKVASTVAIGVWEKQPPTPSMETAYFSWEFEVDAGQTKTVRIAGSALDSLKSAISIADSTSLEFGCYSGGSGLTVIIGVDDTFTE